MVHVPFAMNLYWFHTIGLSVPKGKLIIYVSIVCTCELFHLMYSILITKLCHKQSIYQTWTSPPPQTQSIVIYISMMYHFHNDTAVLGDILIRAIV